MCKAQQNNSLLLKLVLLLFSTLLLPTPAKAVDAVLINDKLQVINLTRNIKQIAPNRFEFAVQNTGKMPISFYLILNGRDVFHDAVLGHFEDPLIAAPLRLIASDDTETVADPELPRQVRVSLKAGEVKRYILLGEIKQPIAFWAWSPAYRQNSEIRYANFQTALLLGLGFFILSGLSVLFIHRNKRLILPPLFIFIFILLMCLLMCLRWHFVPQWMSEEAVLNYLRVVMVMVFLFVVLGHRAVLRMPWVERRYWRSAVLFADTIFGLSVIGWGVLYFYPFFMEIETVEVLELGLVLAPACLGLATIISYRFPEVSRQSQSQN